MINERLRNTVGKLEMAALAMMVFAAPMIACGQSVPSDPSVPSAPYSGRRYCDEQWLVTLQGDYVVPGTNDTTPNYSTAQFNVIVEEGRRVEIDSDGWGIEYNGTNLHNGASGRELLKTSESCPSTDEQGRVIAHSSWSGAPMCKPVDLNRNVLSCSER